MDGLRMELRLPSQQKTSPSPLSTSVALEAVVSVVGAVEVVAAAVVAVAVVVVVVVVLARKRSTLMWPDK